MPTFIVWKPDNAETPTDGGMEIEAFDAETAALKRAELRFSDDEYPEEQTLAVRNEFGAVSIYEISAESVPSFIAREARMKEIVRVEALIEKWAAEEAVSSQSSAIRQDEKEIDPDWLPYPEARATLERDGVDVPSFLARLGDRIEGVAGHRAGLPPHLPTDLDALEALRAKATPGPWRSVWSDPQLDALLTSNDLDQIIIAGPGEPTWAKGGHAVMGTMWYDGPNSACSEHNCAHIIAAVNTQPALIAELRALRKLVAAATTGDISEPLAALARDLYDPHPINAKAPTVLVEREALAAILLSFGISGHPGTFGKSGAGT